MAQPKPVPVLTGRELITACAQAIHQRDQRVREINDLRRTTAAAEKHRDHLDHIIGKMEQCIRGGDYDPAAPDHVFHQ